MYNFFFSFYDKHTFCRRNSDSVTTAEISFIDELRPVAQAQVGEDVSVARAEGEVEQSGQMNANPQGNNFSGKKSSLRKTESFRTKSHTNQSKVNFELKIDEEAETIDNSEMSDDLTGTLQLRMKSSKRRGSSKSSSFRQSRICISIAQKNINKAP